VLIAGGRVPDRIDLHGGAFLEPTIFDQCHDGMKIVQEEIFGPVMSILTFDEEEDAISRANNSPFGLAAGIFTEDLRRAHRVAARLDVGMCWINTYHTLPMEVPFGGNKRSGLGRENGKAALEHHTKIKSVFVELGAMPRYL
jgi:betaine-aldehyde dehydrogenase